MSAEVLREAAALMRSRAEAVRYASPWEPMGAGTVSYRMTKHMSGTVANTFPTGGSDEQWATTEHIASWHPAVALAVADWLAAEADLADDPRQHAEPLPAAIAVARAFLGSDQ